MNMQTDTSGPTPDYPWMQSDLDRLAADNNCRALHDAEPLPGGRVRLDGQELLNFGSNDYLGLLTELQPAAAPVGAAASRLIYGNHPQTAALERDLADWHGKEAALVFGSGYLTNLACLSALTGRGDVIFADRLNHASLIDGACLSRARHLRYDHNDMASLAKGLEEHTGARRKIIVAEALFSMDGDTAPLAELVRLKQRYKALLMIDEAHSLGVYGTAGSGLAAAAGLAPEVDLLVGTLSKAFACYGGYVAGSRQLIEYLVNHARPLIFSTGLPPIITATARQALEMVKTADDRRARLQRLANSLRQNLGKIGLHVGRSTTHIIPVIVGSNEAAMGLADNLRQHGIAAPGIRPPTVPQGQARIRLSLTAGHDTNDQQRLLDVLRKWAATRKDKTHGNV